MTLSDKVMGWIAAQDGPRTMAEVCAAFPNEEAKRVRWVISSMVSKRGRLVRHGVQGSATYTIAPGGARDRRFRPTAKQQPTVRRRAAEIAPKSPIIRANVSGDVAAFLAAGGRIQRLPRTATATPFQRIDPGQPAWRVA